MRYDLNLLPVFIALIEERSVTRAALRLGITQPALSNALNRLRDTLQDPLFIRERYGIRPTQFAEQIAPVIVDTLARLDEALIGRQHFDPATANRQFNVAANSYVEIVLMPGIIARLRQLAPGIKMSLTPYGNDLAETGVMSGTTDMVLGRLIDPPDNLVAQHLMDDGLACVVRVDHPDIGDSLSREQYEQLRHVNIQPPGRLRAGLFQALDRQGLKRELAISVTHFLAVPEIIAVTDYCATLPRLICKQIARDPRLKVVPAPVDLGTFPVEIAWHVRYRNDPAHKWFRQLLVETATALSGAH
ncbi:PCP degradation transcriptional activation protein [Pseudomonas fluorescens]|uniref:PCP degradation transcriptional activation protein n=1 Tax=Pseudomonas fluorescens TaxID=294 RepID=A0A5E7R3Q5_PSEFL|nr:LysR substrate-binding domain-containing protein [Pseudomonas fluorescens]VVP68037.1 PCP degradation transcriptional activation protein [Pseudomonas fluorescens]